VVTVIGLLRTVTELYRECKDLSTSSRLGNPHISPRFSYKNYERNCLHLVPSDDEHEGEDPELGPGIPQQSD